MYNFSNQKILVIGIAKSGVAAAKVLAKKGARVTACDIKEPTLITELINELQQCNIEVWTGSYPEVKLGKYDLLVVSPGVPLSIAPLQAAYELNIPVIGEVELAYRLKSAGVQMYAITGTNGKTTTTALLEAILIKDGQKAIAGGNIGIPLSKLVDDMQTGVIAVEVSSFQLETTLNFKPHIAGLLNITPDHLDRHKTMAAYIEAKAKVFAYQDKDDFTIINYEDEILRSLAGRTKAQIIYFSTDRVLAEGVFVEENMIKAVMKDKLTVICNVDKLSLKGKHNLENILCAVAMALAAMVKPENIAEVVQTFPGVRHRLEEVLNHKGIVYINDSKATNPESAIKALEAFDKPLILIAGGRGKGASFENFIQVLIKKVKAVILLGEAKEEIKTLVMSKNYTNIYEVDSLEQAVKVAHQLAIAGDVVLLSPACASWDMFANYEQRGDIFCDLVHSINAEYGSY